MVGMSLPSTPARGKGRKSDKSDISIKKRYETVMKFGGVGLDK
jgi:hypothetical protein